MSSATQARFAFPLALLFSFAIPTAAGAAPASAVDDAKAAQSAADAAFQRMDWAKAYDAYRRLSTASSPAPTVQTWVRLATAARQLSKVPESLAALDAAAKLGLPAAQLHLQRARTYLRTDDRDAVFAELEKAVAAGFGNRMLLAYDPELAGLAADPRLVKLGAAFDAAGRPCLADPEFRRFDFWIGEWDVRGAGQNPALPPAASTIELVLEGCALLENYTTIGYSGKSFTFYDAARRRWQQTYVDSTGTLMEFHGAFREAGVLALEADILAPGTPQATKNRLTFFRKGADEVRQLWEQSSDDGATWAVVFDGTYLRKNRPAANP